MSFPSSRSRSASTASASRLSSASVRQRNGISRGPVALVLMESSAALVEVVIQPRAASPMTVANGEHRSRLGGMARTQQSRGDRSARCDRNREAMTLAQPRKAPLSRRWKYRLPPRPKAPIDRAPVRPADEVLTPVDQMRVDKWIRDRLIDWHDSCWHCRKPIVVGQAWTVVSNGEVVARRRCPMSAQFHAACSPVINVNSDSVGST
jgi:hypothetical protein